MYIPKTGIEKKHAWEKIKRKAYQMVGHATCAAQSLLTEICHHLAPMLGVVLSPGGHIRTSTAVTLTSSRCLIYLGVLKPGNKSSSGCLYKNGDYSRCVQDSEGCFSDSRTHVYEVSAPGVELSLVNSLMNVSFGMKYDS